MAYHTRTTILFLYILSFLCIALSVHSQTADTFFIHGKIITVDAAFSIHSALAVKGDNILAVGSEESLQPLKGNDTKVIDLEGKTMMPGLIDSHAHPIDACITEFDHPIPEMDSIQDVLDYIKSRTKVLDEGQWIFVSQVFLTRLAEGRYPTKAELDSVAPKHPVIFRTGPDASVNSLALKMSGIGKGWKVDDGGSGFAETDPKTGEPTGIMRNCSRYLKYENPNKQPTVAQHAEQLKKLFADYNRVGITSVSDRATSPSDIDIYKTLNDRGELTVRSYIARHVDTIQSMEKIIDEIQQVRRSPLYQGSDMLQVRTVKTFMDGGMLTGSAYMRQPWGVSDFYNISDPNYRGVRFIPESKWIPIARECMKNDVQLIAHCVGDGAVHAFIDGFLALKDEFDIRKHRPVICHSNFMSEEAVHLTAENGICVDIQPAWLYLDTRTLLEQFGYERMTWFQPLRSLMSYGTIAGGGSDHMQKIGSKRSINFYDPWMGMWVAMTRNAKWVDKPLHPEQALSRVEALRFYTINNAYILFADDKRGSLEPGKLADMIVIDRDILTCPVDEIKDIQVLQTYLGGKRVYSKS